jgi:hypothetical protein
MGVISPGSCILHFKKVLSVLSAQFCFSFTKCLLSNLKFVFIISFFSFVPFTFPPPNLFKFLLIKRGKNIAYEIPCWH